MSTRSAIIVKTGKNSYEGIYCHNDGYFAGVGKTLKEFFNTKKDAKAIIKLGDCSAISEKVRINPVGKHSYNMPEDGTIIAYHRDRGEIYNPPTKGKTWKDVASKIDHSGYVYVWENDKWNSHNLNT
jgi:hypothetical protein